MATSATDFPPDSMMLKLDCGEEMKSTGFCPYGSMKEEQYKRVSSLGRDLDKYKETMSKRLDCQKGSASGHKIDKITQAPDPHIHSALEPIENPLAATTDVKNPVKKTEKKRGGGFLSVSASKHLLERERIMLSEYARFFAEDFSLVVIISGNKDFVPAINKMTYRGFEVVSGKERARRGTQTGRVTTYVVQFRNERMCEEEDLYPRLFVI
ncbi:hypothetical protein F2Q69_00049438 [Brassica cretica]|uniref:NYN domain-containing protein n=1 Tax=Brassica cretica TaxID=69181 RepID=A0A8S9PG11_BRACR|nr:hypothetical protein F2Q69_00049438 [Brassica cretica]